MQQPVPKVSRADVERVVRRDFSANDVDRVLAMLDEYQFEGRTPWRVQLAVLKLAAGDIATLKREIEVAKADFRDVIAPAEYPKYSRYVRSRDFPDAEKQPLIDEDWKQYESWLRR
jgi:hypothetical protein